ncbi:hypothetical protein BGZ46_005684, partial [Entomortierella lignicola]
VLKASAKHTAQFARAIQAGYSSSNNGYQGLPANANGSFGRARYSKKDNSASWRNRRLARIIFFSVLAAFTIIWIFAVPNTLKPLHDRDIWIRYFNHEEAIKVTLPYRRVVHVHDVKKSVLKELDHGFYMQHFLTNVKLITSEGLLRSDEVWDNNHGRFSSSAQQPILAVAPQNELFKFLNETLGCFSGADAYDGNVFNIKFLPDNGYGQLASVLYKINNDNSPGYWHQSVSNLDILYLRNGFNDPKKGEILPPYEDWTPPKRTRPAYMDPLENITIDRDISWMISAPARDMLR